MPDFSIRELKVVAAVLYEQFGATQQQLGQVLGKKSQSTVSSWIKEGKYIMQVEQQRTTAEKWKSKCEEMANELKSLGYRPVSEPIDVNEVRKVVVEALELDK